MCANFVAVVLLSWMPKFLFDRFHMGLAMAGLTATIFVQLASMAGAPVGGWLADACRRQSPRGRMAVQAIGMFGGAFQEKTSLAAPDFQLEGVTVGEKIEDGPEVQVLETQLRALRPAPSLEFDRHAEIIATGPKFGQRVTS